LKKDKFKDIDDLIDYINKDEEEEIKPKKNKKKNNKKDKKNNTGNLNQIGSSLIDREKMEKEIEDFKLYIKNNSLNALNVRKIKPVLTREWLQNLAANNQVKSI